jgi:hypothetical protein
MSNGRATVGLSLLLPSHGRQNALSDAASAGHGNMATDAWFRVLVYPNSSFANLDVTFNAGLDFPKTMHSDQGGCAVLCLIHFFFFLCILCGIHTFPGTVCSLSVALHSCGW